MMSALWVSKTGLAAQDTSLRTISNNLANVSTVGYKRERAVFRDLLYQVQEQPGGLSSQDTTLPSGLQLGTGVEVGATQKIFTKGDLQATEQPLDLAIDGRGFFQVAMPDGSLTYTRDGQFQLSEEGEIVTAEGYRLEPSLNVPSDAQSITIAADGTVSAMLAGSTSVTQLGNIQIADFVNPAGLQAIGGNLFRETPASGAPLTGNPGSNGLGGLLQGNLENSNVNVVEEMVNMVSTQRAYEMNSRVVSTADQMLQFVTQNL
ncbi:MAG: flagellar basal-body rod protein FlgG [Pseudomonadales bacterium]